MKLLRQVVSSALVAAVTCFTTHSLDLHVHAWDHDSDHRHGLAAHRHDPEAALPHHGRSWSDHDDDDTVIPVRLCAASTSSSKPNAIQHSVVTLDQRPRTAVITPARVVARAHGPPASRYTSLRAPPASQPL